MVNFQIKLINAQAVQSAFQAAPDLMKPALKRAINKSLLLIGRKASINSPVRTSNLRTSILDPYRGLTLATDSIFYRGSVGSGTNYGLFVEMGTRFMRAQPYLRPAVKDSNSQIQDNFHDEVQGVLDIIAARASL